jgi:hypothetical protein
LDHLYRSASNSVIGLGWDTEERRDLTYPERQVLALEGTKPPARYFELGVGKGLLYQEFHRRGWDCVGVEPGSWAPHVRGLVQSLHDVPASQAFDVLIANDVLEHLSDPVAMLRTVRAIADTGSTLYAAFPNRRSFRSVVQKGQWRMVRPLGHVHYFSKASARLTLEKSGFALRTARTNDLAVPSLRQPRSLVFGAVQALGWGDQWLVSAIPATNYEPTPSNEGALDAIDDERGLDGQVKS